MQKPTFNKRAGGMSYWLARGEPGCRMTLGEAEQSRNLRSSTVSKIAADATRQRAGRQRKAPDSATEAPGRSGRTARAARAHSAEGAGPAEKLKTLKKSSYEAAYRFAQRNDKPPAPAQMAHDSRRASAQRSWLDWPVDNSGRPVNGRQRSEC